MRDRAFFISSVTYSKTMFYNIQNIPKTCCTTYKIISLQSVKYVHLHIEKPNKTTI